MRTEVKIGIVVGLVVAISFVAYFAVRSMSKQDQAPPAQQAAPPRTPSPIAIPAAGAPSASTVNTAPPVAVVPAAPGGVATLTGTPASVPPAGIPASGAPGIAPGVTAQDRTAMQNLLYGTGGRPAPGVAPASVPGATALRPVAGGPREYVVKAGDTGTAIAIAEYGHAKHFKLIEQANPGVNWNNLRVGSTLKVPPLPAGTTGSALTGTPSTMPAVAGGITPGRTTLIPAAGQRVYKVQASDTRGLWGIAEREYGSGSYHVAISKANPGLDSTRLRPGQELILPAKAELDAAISSARSGSVRPTSPVAVSSGITSTPRTVSSSGRPLFD